jgi:hypothetical protein
MDMDEDDLPAVTALYSSQDAIDAEDRSSLVPGGFSFPLRFPELFGGAQTTHETEPTNDQSSILL